MSLRGDRIAVVGDMHGKWNRLDNQFFDAARPDLLLFVGDLGSGTLRNGLEMIREISGLRVPGLVLPGNNDAEHLAQLEAELAHQAGKADLLKLVGGTNRRGVEPCGYSSHLLETEHGPTTLIAGRPCAMGGSEFSFAAQVERNYQVGSLRESEKRLRALVDQSETETLVFLAHNGPYGLGDEASDIWGRDFPLAPELEEVAPRDWGDKDLQAAIAHAKDSGKTVLAVVAGHMHRGRRAGGRPLSVEHDGTTYINAAAVPRIRAGEFGEVHHHVELRLFPNEGRVELAERWVEVEE